tara:strand:+ start:63 stop:488 length:426 start_codon:yes stop_codon:yes gene_type:complete
MYCGNISKSIGTYLEVEEFKFNLLNAGIEYLSSNSKEVTDLIDYLKDFISIEGICYQNYSIELTNKLKLYGLSGIISFIMKNEFDNVISFGESMDFIFSIDLIKDNLELKYFINERKKIENFYLFQILMRSIKNFKVIELY